MGPFLYFAILTLIYTVIRYKVTNPQSEMIWGLIYLGLLLVGMYLINLGITKTMCGTTQPGTAIMVTAIPWSMVFGVMILMLLAFPGWLSPFSNTLGYLVAKLAGLSTITDKIFASKAVRAASSTTGRAAAEALEQIYSDKALLVNQVTPENFETFWSKMSDAKLFNTGAAQYKSALYNLIRMKKLVAEMVWALLSGGLASSIATSYIQNTACVQSAKEMIQRHNQYEDENTDDQKKKLRVYDVTN